MYFLITYVAPNLTFFVHELVNNNHKHQERREIDYICSQKTQTGLNSPLGNIAHQLLFLHVGGYQRKLVIIINMRWQIFNPNVSCQFQKSWENLKLLSSMVSVTNIDKCLNENQFIGTIISFHIRRKQILKSNLIQRA